MLALKLLCLGVGLVKAALVFDDYEELHLDSESEIPSDQLSSLRTLKDLGHHTVTYSRRAHDGSAERALISQKGVDAKIEQSAKNIDGDRRITYVGHAKSGTHGERMDPSVIASSLVEDTGRAFRMPFPPKADVSRASEPTKQLLQIVTETWAAQVHECLASIRLEKTELENINNNKESLMEQFARLKSEPWTAMRVFFSDLNINAMQNSFDLPGTMLAVQSKVSSLRDSMRRAIELVMATDQFKLKEGEEVAGAPQYLARLELLQAMNRSFASTLGYNVIPEVDDHYVQHAAVLRPLRLKIEDWGFTTGLSFYTYALTHSFSLFRAIRGIAADVGRVIDSDLTSSLQGIQDEIEHGTSGVGDKFDSFFCRLQGVECYDDSALGS